jgi:sugar phosphate isomerase/epimerase
MQARELKALVEAAGTDFVGVCLDSGNALWALEDPHLALETLAPLVLTSHVRDSVVCHTTEGIVVTWTRMGHGNVRIADYLRSFAGRCPAATLSLEVILNGPRTFDYRDPQFWDAYRQTPAWEFARFLALAEAGTHTAAAVPPPDPANPMRQLDDVQASIRWTREFLVRSGY